MTTKLEHISIRFVVFLLSTTVILFGDAFGKLYICNI